MDRKERIVSLLGMSHGAAANRLRKMVLFRQLKKYGDNVCVRCGKPIDAIEDLSIEHIKPWEGRSAELFWDLDNIAFSHSVCNSSFRVPYSGPSHRRVKMPDGMSWCRTHKEFLPVENFAIYTSRWNRLRHDCRECEKKYKDFIRYGKTPDGVTVAPSSEEREALVQI